MKKLFVISMVISVLLAWGMDIKKSKVEMGKRFEVKYSKKNLIVEFREFMPKEIKSSLSNMNTLENKSYKIEYLDNILSNNKIGILKIKGDVDIIKVMKELRRNPLVKKVSLDYERKIMSYIPNDKLFDKQWALKPDDKIKNININGVWENNRGSREVIIGVIDSGESLLHEDLKKNLWVNEKELTGKPGVDDDNDGYVDDIYGYDFNYDNNGKEAPLNGDGLTSHGTHVSGIIGAVGDNGIGVSGVNMKVTIVPVKIMTQNGHMFDSVELKGINYLLALKKKKGLNIVAINASYGGIGGNVDSSPIKDAIKELGNNGIIFFAAAGNSEYDNDELYYDYPNLPSSYNLNNIVSVAAIKEDGKLAYFSQYGKKTVQVAAPGWKILSTVDRIEGNETGNRDFFDNFDSNKTKLEIKGWSISDSEFHSPNHSITTNTSSDEVYISSKNIDLTKEENNSIAIDFCIKNEKNKNSVFEIYFYDIKTDKWDKIDINSDLGEGDWKCIGIPIPNYYKTDKFRFKFLVNSKEDIKEGEIYLDDIKIGDYNKTNGYDSWSGTSMATPMVTGAYGLLTSINPNENMYSKISRIIGNGEKLNNNIMGVNLNIGDIVNQPSKPLIFNTKKVMHVDNEAVFDVYNAGSNPKVYIGDKKVDVISDNNGKIRVKVENNDKNYIIVQNGDLNSSNRLYISKWKMLTNIPGGLVNSHIFGNKIIYKDKLYILNGQNINNGNINNKIDIYDLNKNSWNSSKNINPYTLVLATSKEYNGKIYIFGGESNNYNTNVIIYDIENDMFSIGTNLPIKIDFTKTILYKDKIYLIGGVKVDDNITNNVYEYDIKNDKFIKKASIPKKVILSGVCRFKDKIYLFGGANKINMAGNYRQKDKEVYNSAYEYDIKTDKWKKIANLPMKAEGMACANIDDKFIAILFGDDGKKMIDSILEYNPNTDRYKELNNSVLENILQRVDISDNLLEYNDTLYYVGGLNFSLDSLGIDETKTIESIKKEAFIIKDEANKTISNFTSSSKRFLPAFNLIALLIMLGGSLFIIRRKV